MIYPPTKALVIDWCYFLKKGVGEVQQKKKGKKKERKKEHLSFYDIEELMGVHKHIYKRHKGAKRQVR